MKNIILFLTLFYAFVVRGDLRVTDERARPYPSVTIIERNAITGQQTGDTIFCSDCSAQGQIQIWDSVGVAWKPLEGAISAPATTNARALIPWNAADGSALGNQAVIFHDDVNNNIVVGAATGNPKSLLELQTNSAGLMLPRMTEVERDAIGAAGVGDQGLLIYNTTTDSVESFDGSTGTWITLKIATGLVLRGTVEVSPYTNPNFEPYSVNDYVVCNSLTGTTAPLGPPFTTGGVAECNTGDWLITSDTGVTWDIVAFSGQVNAKIQSSTGNAKVDVEESGDDNIIRFVTSGTEWMNMTPTGQLGLGVLAPDSSAMFAVSSTTQGVLFPRMDSAQRDLIGSPATSLLIFNTDTNQYEFFDGVGFTSLGGGASGKTWELSGTFDNVCPPAGDWRRNGATAGTTGVININTVDSSGNELGSYLSQIREDDNITLYSGAGNESYKLTSDPIANGACYQFPVTLVDSVADVMVGATSNLVVSWLATGGVTSGTFTYQLDSTFDANCTPLGGVYRRDNADASLTTLLTFKGVDVNAVAFISEFQGLRIGDKITIHEIGSNHYNSYIVNATSVVVGGNCEQLGVTPDPLHLFGTIDANDFTVGTFEYIAGGNAVSSISAPVRADGLIAWSGTTGSEIKEMVNNDWHFDGNGFILSHDNLTNGGRIRLWDAGGGNLDSGIGIEASGDIMQFTATGKDHRWRVGGYSGIQLMELNTSGLEVSDEITTTAINPNQGERGHMGLRSAWVHFGTEANKSSLTGYSFLTNAPFNLDTNVNTIINSVGNGQTSIRSEGNIQESWGSPITTYKQRIYQMDDMTNVGTGADPDTAPDNISMDAEDVRRAIIFSRPLTSVGPRFPILMRGDNGNFTAGIRTDNKIMRWVVGDDADEHNLTEVLRMTATGGLRLADSFEFPTATGNAGEILKTDASGNLSWQPDDGGANSWINGWNDADALTVSATLNWTLYGWGETDSGDNNYTFTTTGLQVATDGLYQFSWSSVNQLSERPIWISVSGNRRTPVQSHPVGGGRVNQSFTVVARLTAGQEFQVQRTGGADHPQADAHFSCVKLGN